MAMRIFLRNVATFITLACGLLGLILSLQIVHAMFGSQGVFYGIFLFPFVLAYFPFYTLFVYDSWTLFLLIYGSLAVSWVMLSIADYRDNLPRSAIEEPSTRPVVTKETSAVAIFLLLIGGLLIAAIVSNLARS
jgi:hypothetical protein